MFKNVKAVMDGANTDASHVLKTTARTRLTSLFAKKPRGLLSDPHRLYVVGFLEGYG
jgi:hypothetical protein